MITNVWKGMAAGLIGGLVASWTMNRFQDVWSSLTKDVAAKPDNHFENVRDESDRPVARSSATRGPQPEVQDDTTVRAATVVSAKLFDHTLTQSEKKIAGTAVHYILGTGVGGIYGAANEIAPKVSAGAGLPFGAVFWLVVDEGAVPLLGLSKGPVNYPLSTHAYALSSHLVYGLTAELVRRAVRNAF